MIKCPKRAVEFKKRAVDLHHTRGSTYAEIAHEPGYNAGSVGGLDEEGAQRGLSGVAYVHTRRDWLYLVVMMNVWSRKMVNGTEEGREAGR